MNEEVDPAVMIRKLKKENTELKAQIALLNGEDFAAARVTPEDRERVLELVRVYVAAHANPEAELIVGDMNRIQCAFGLLRAMVLEAGPSTGAPKLPAICGAEGAMGEEAEEQLHKLQLQIQQRDNEINILVSVVGVLLMQESV